MTDEEKCQLAVEAFRQFGSKQAAADHLGIPRKTLSDQIKRAGFMANRPPPKILFIDIETKPAIAHVWQLFDVTVGLSQVVEPGGTICFAAKWKGSKTMHFHSDWTDGHEAMVRAAHDLLSQADAVVTYNGDRFDIPKLRGEFLLANLPPPPPITSIDVYKSVKKLGLMSNKLAFVGPTLTGEGKVQHEGHELWVKVMAGDPAAEKKMERYCRQDVALLEKVYAKMRPYIPNHPHMGMTKRDECGACGSTRLESREFRRTKASLIQRLQCQKCGSWQDGKREAA